jgi:hypothetical protein
MFEPLASLFMESPIRGYDLISSAQIRITWMT